MITSQIGWYQIDYESSKRVYLNPVYKLSAMSVYRDYIVWECISPN